MFQIDEVLNHAPFSVQRSEKDILFGEALDFLTNHHYNHCSEYKAILENMKYKPDVNYEYAKFPFLPVRLFKEFKLSSIGKDKIFKIMNSSGTSGQEVSSIYLDRENANLQTKVLVKLVSSVIGNKRLPMLIIDSKAVIKNRKQFTARGAGVIGFSIFGKDVTYALDDEMTLDVQAIEEFTERHKDEKILIFGFTSIIWKQFVEHIKQNNIEFPSFEGYLIHGGGWKKLQDEAVSTSQFKEGIYETCGIKNVINYYGMVEQTGSIFLECSEGYLHTSIFSDVIMRRTDFSVCDFREIGLVQLISLLPTSYPGHNIISEDLGEIIGVDDCKCGWYGKYFQIHGRAERAEIRGCSDTID